MKGRGVRETPPGLTTAYVAAFLASLSFSEPVAAQNEVCDVDTVSRTAIATHLRTAARAGGEFDIVATTNWPRLQSELYLELAREAMRRRPRGGVLYISSRWLFDEFYRLAGLSSGALAPPHLLWQYQLDAGTLLAYRPDGIIREVILGRMPELAINVRTAWPDREDGREAFSFIDRLSVPVLRVTNRQEITFRLLDFGDMVVYDEIEGTSGRPLSGLLGQLFKVIGEGNMEFSRSAISGDGIQVVRAQATKWGIARTLTLTVWPDGQAENGLPEGRPDLEAIAERLMPDLDIEYYPFFCW